MLRTQFGTCSEVARYACHGQQKRKKRAEMSLQLKCTLVAWGKLGNAKSVYVCSFPQSRFRSTTDVSWIPSAGRPSTAGGTGAKVKGVRKGRSRVLYGGRRWNACIPVRGPHPSPPPRDTPSDSLRSVWAFDVAFTVLEGAPRGVPSAFSFSRPPAGDVAVKRATASNVHFRCPLSAGLAAVKWGPLLECPHFAPRFTVTSHGRPSPSVGFSLVCVCTASP